MFPTCFEVWRTKLPQLLLETIISLLPCLLGSGAQMSTAAATGVGLVGPAGSCQLKLTHCRTHLCPSAKRMASCGKQEKTKNARWRQVERTKMDER